MSEPYVNFSTKYFPNCNLFCVCVGNSKESILFLKYIWYYDRYWVIKRKRQATYRLIWNTENNRLHVVILFDSWPVALLLRNLSLNQPEFDRPLGSTFDKYPEITRQLDMVDSCVKFEFLRLEKVIRTKTIRFN